MGKNSNKTKTIRKKPIPQRRYLWRRVPNNRVDNFPEVFNISNCLEKLTKDKFPNLEDIWFGLLIYLKEKKGKIKILKPKIKLLFITPNAEKFIEECGRTAYMSFSKITEDSAATFIKSKIIANGHFSVLEHAVATFRISNVSRAFSHQEVRFRIKSYTQKSQRYCNEDKFDYIIPPALLEHKDLLKEYKDFMKNAAALYRKLQYKCNEFGNPILDENGNKIRLLKNEDARFILPNACTTEIVTTANFREWRHCIEQRCAKDAQWEIREVYLHILKILYNKCPSVFEDLYNKFI